MAIHINSYCTGCKYAYGNVCCNPKDCTNNDKKTRR